MIDDKALPQTRFSTITVLSHNKHQYLQLSAELKRRSLPSWTTSFGHSVTLQWKVKRSKRSHISHRTGWSYRLAWDICFCTAQSHALRHHRCKPWDKLHNSKTKVQNFSMTRKFKIVQETDAKWCKPFCDWQMHQQKKHFKGRCSACSARTVWNLGLVAQSASLHLLAKGCAVTTPVSCISALHCGCRMSKELGVMPQYSRAAMPL